MNQVELMKVILSPRFTEKSTRLSDKYKCFTFKVARDASKPDIKAAIELLFEVQVDRVRTLNVKGSVRRFGKIMGMTKDWKKAYVTLKPGQDINFVEGE